MISFLSQFTLLVFGSMLLGRILLPKSHKLESLSVGFLMNIGVFTYLWFVLNILGLPYNSTVSLVALTFLLLVFFILFSFVYKKRVLVEMSSVLNIKLRKLNKIEIVFVISISFLFLSSLINNLYWPVKDWDSLALYDFRALVFKSTGNMIEGVELGYFFQYPLFTSLFHTWIYVNGLDNPMFIYSLIYINFVIVFYYSLRSFGGRATSLFWTLIVASLPLIYGHSTIAYTNLSYSVFFVLSSMYLYKYSLSFSRGELITSSVLLSLSIWTRYSEPFWVVPIIITVLFTLFKRKYLDLLIYLIIIFGSRYLWIKYVSLISFIVSDVKVINDSLTVLFNGLNLDHLHDIYVFLNNNILPSLSVIFLIMLLSITKKYLESKKLYNLYLIYVISNLFILLIGLYIFSLTFEDWQNIPDSASRMVMFFPFMFVYYIVLSNNEKK